MKIFRAEINWIISGLLCLGISVPLLAQQPADDKKITEETEKLRTEIKTDIEAIKGIIEKARKLSAEKNYPEAIGYYSEAQEALQKHTGEVPKRMQVRLENEISTFRSRWSENILSKARSEFQKEKYEEAIVIASEAALVDSRRGSEVQKFIDSCKREQKAQGFAQATSMDVFNPEYAKREKQIEILYREALKYYQANRLNEARNKLEQIYLIDPFNTKGNVLLAKCYNQLYKVGQYRHNAEVDGIISWGDWEWNEGILPTSIERSIKTPSQTKTQSTAEVHAKMESIIFPTVEFDEADINSVIRYLDRGAKRYDPEKGNISIIAGFDSTVAATLPKVSMSFTKMPLSEVLRYLCKSVDLKYKIEDRAVIIGIGVDDMQTEYFQVRGDLISDIAPASADGETKAPSLVEGGALSAGTAAAKTFETFDTVAAGSQRMISSDDLKAYFELRGIKFEEGSSIAYDNRSGRLIVKNTLENLRKMDELLRQLDMIKFPLVLIETKIVEIKQTDVNELGFDWMFNIPTQDGQSWSINDGGQGNPLRYYSTDGENTRVTGQGELKNSSSYKVINDLKIFPNFGESIFGKGMDVNLSLSVYAIAQNSRTETLSAPKILTTSGSTASISMVEQYYFAEDWDEPEVNSSGNNITIQPPTPDWGDARDIGIELSVTPVVSPDNYTIELHLVPQITAYLGDDTYPIDIVTWRTNSEGQRFDVRTLKTDITMPNIAIRNLNVHIKVYDGETIVLGGMIQNKTVNRNDKWPVIGEIPILGRFFGSQLALQERINMLIFVTTRLVNNDGVPVRRDKERGLPDFYR